MSTVIEFNSPSHSNGLVLNTDYVREYENIDNYSYSMVSDNHGSVDEDDEQSRRQIVPNTLVGELGDSENDQPNTVTDNNNSNENHDAVHGDHQGDEPLKPELVVPRRKPKMHGNALLIDELKKRQSTLYQSAD